MSSDVLPRHAALTPEEGIHGVVAGTTADATAWSSGSVVDPPSAAARTVDAQDAGKLFRRISDNTYWILANHSPVTWRRADWGAWDSTSFSTTIAFSSPWVRRMPQQTVSGALTFTASLTGAVAGATTYVRLVSNAVNVPAFSGLTEWGGSAGWDNRNGIVNCISFWHDGDTAWYSIVQAANAVPLDTTAPTLVSAIVPSAAPTTIVLTYNETLDAGSVPATGAYSVTNSGGTQNVTAVGISGAIVTLTTSRTVLATDTISVSYTPGAAPVRDAAGNNAGSLSSQAVTNQVGGTWVRLQTINAANVTESGDATNGWIYTRANGNLASAYAGNSSKSLPASTAGYFEARLLSTASGQFPCFYVRTVSTAGPYTSADAFGIYADGTTYFAIQGGTGNVALNGTVVAAASADRIRIVRTGTNAMTAQVSKNSGSTWTTVHTFTTSTSQLWCNVDFEAGTPSIGYITGSGIV